MTDSYLRCTVCGRTSTTDFASSLRTGWERCCGYTMRLERTTANIEAAVATAFDAAEVVSAPASAPQHAPGDSREGRP